MRVLVIGSGAREHAICRALSRDPDVTALMCAPGNPGTAAIAEQLPVALDDSAAIAGLAVDRQADLVVIGPEAPLVAGAADAVRARGIACFGPDAGAAQLEGSKAFAKEVMAAADVPTAMSRLCTNEAEAADALDQFGAPYVVKDDGLAAGKGVVVTDDREVALQHAAACGRVVIEEYLDGPEVSLFCVTDGKTVVALQPAQDFKRAGDNDTGPNTGGMGAYSPLPWAPADLVDEVVARVAQPTIDEMAARGTPFAGLLYVGLALTHRGLRVVEFNARFGDPETQAVLELLQTPLGQLLHAAATGHLDSVDPLRWADESAVVVVLAADGYPASPRVGDPITGADQHWVLHAGTAHDANGQLVTAGGRVVSVLGTGESLSQARESAYNRAEAVRFAGAHYRSDIAKAAAESEDR